MNQTIISEYFNQIAHKKQIIEQRNKNISVNNLLYAFRGESQDYHNTKLMPSLFRDKNNVNKELFLFELLGDYNVLENDTNRYIEKAISAQHYTAISRLLDITFSILPSLYFASSKHPSKPGYLYVFGFPDYYSPHSTYIENIYKQTITQNSCVYNKNFRIISNARYNERVNAQCGGFIFFPGDEFSPINDIYYERIEIKAKDKEPIINELKEFFDITEERLFPDKEKFSMAAKDQFLRRNYNSSTEISVENELKIYFERIDYELEMIVKDKSKNYTTEQIARLIRKEEDDLVYYLEQLNQQDKKQWIKEKFDILRRSKI